MAFHQHAFYVAKTTASCGRARRAGVPPIAGVRESLRGAAGIRRGRSCSVPTARCMCRTARHATSASSGFDAGDRDAVRRERRQRARLASGLSQRRRGAVDPATKAIWVTVNERDNLEPDHQNSPPDKINIIHAGGFYGWPYCWGDHNASPEFHDAAKCTSMIVPALNVQAHSAYSGITFLDRATMLPPAMRGDALVASHGSWNATLPTGDKIIRVHIANGQPQSYDTSSLDGSAGRQPVGACRGCDGWRRTGRCWSPTTNWARFTGCTLTGVAPARALSRASGSPPGHPGEPQRATRCQLFSSRMLTPRFASSAM